MLRTWCVVYSPLQLTEELKVELKSHCWVRGSGLPRCNLSLGRSRTNPFIFMHLYWFNVIWTIRMICNDWAIVKDRSQFS